MSTTMTATDVAGNPYIGKTRAIARPTNETHRPGPRLDQLQARWDQAEDRAAENDRLRAEHLKKVDADRKAKADAGRKSVEDQFVDGLRKKYLAADPSATEAEFQEDLPKLRRQHRIDAALASDAAADDAARFVNARRYG